MGETTAIVWPFVILSDFELGRSDAAMLPHETTTIIHTIFVPDAQVGMMWVNYHTKMVYDGLKKTFPDEVPVTLARSGWTGTQRYGASNWNGDLTATWTNFKKTVVAGLNAQLSGNTHMNCLFKAYHMYCLSKVYHMNCLFKAYHMNCLSKAYHMNCLFKAFEHVRLILNPFAVEDSRWLYHSGRLLLKCV